MFKVTLKYTSTHSIEDVGEKIFHCTSFIYSPSYLELENVEWHGSVKEKFIIPYSNVEYFFIEYIKEEQ